MSSFAIRVYHRGEGFFLSYHFEGHSIGLSKEVGQARRFSSPGSAYAALRRIDRLTGVSQVVEIYDRYIGVGLLSARGDDLILSWNVSKGADARTPKQAHPANDNPNSNANLEGGAYNLMIPGDGDRE